MKAETERTFRGSYYLYTLKGHLLTLPALTLLVIFEVPGLSKLLTATLLLSGWLVVLHLTDPKRSSVSISGSVVAVHNPFRTYQFEASQLTITDTDSFGIRAPGSVVVQDSKDGAPVVCYGLGRRLFFRSNTELQDFRIAIQDLGGQVYVLPTRWSPSRRR